MMQSIPASQLVNVVGSVLAAGGTALDLNQVVLTQSTRAPIGSVPAFPTPAAVGAYFGLSSPEYALAQIYFAGFTGANATPGSMLFAQYPETAVAAYIRGGLVSGMTLSALQALSGSLDITIDGYAFAAAAINLSTATSFSAAAGLIQTALAASPPTGATAPTVTFDSISGAFVVTSGTTGGTSTMAYATGTLAASLCLTNATGAVLSQGAAAATPGSFMPGVTAATTNWATFMLAWSATVTESLEFAAWTTAQRGRYAFVQWDADINNQAANSTVTFTYLNGPNGANNSGTIANYAPVNGAQIPAFAGGMIAAIDFTEVNGRISLSYKSTPGLAADVTNGTVAANLIASGTNFYGAFGTANQTFTFYYPGAISGPRAWADSYVNAIWLNNQLQLAIMVGMTAVKSVPYAAIGYATIMSWLTDPVEQGVTFGAIVPGITLSAAQVQELKVEAGLDISQSIINQGYYLQVLPAIAQVRGLRQSPPCTLWYSDGGSVNSLNLASVEVQ